MRKSTFVALELNKKRKTRYSYIVFFSFVSLASYVFIDTPIK